MGRDANGTGARWQGYSHRELYEMLHSGPGSGAAGPVADTWSGMAGALSDIQQELTAGIAASGATWTGDAADQARGALGPLGEWAQQASTAADVMRVSVELQGDLLAKARADMPAPVTVPQQTSQISQLVMAQVDYEVAEMASQVAAHDAYQVMAQYEAATADNTSTLGNFGEPPRLVVDTTPITGPVASRPVEFAEPSRVGRSPSGRVSASARRFAGGSGGTEGSVRRGTSGGSSSPREESVGAAEHESGPAEHESGPVSRVPEETTHAASASGARSAGVGSAGARSAAGVRSADVRSAGDATAPSAADGSTTPSSAGGGRDRRSRSPQFVPQAGGDRFSGGAVVPAARRPGEEDEQGDTVHESRYLLESEDIYGASQTYSPPVIGESGPRR